MADAKKAAMAKRFFKTGPGQYGESDVFLGIKVPQSRQIAKKYISLPFNQVKVLLDSNIHEERHVALLIPALLLLPVERPKMANNEAKDWFL